MTAARKQISWCQSNPVRPWSHRVDFFEVHGTYSPIIAVLVTVLQTILGHFRAYSLVDKYHEPSSIAPALDMVMVLLQNNLNLYSKSSSSYEGHEA